MKYCDDLWWSLCTVVCTVTFVYSCTCHIHFQVPSMFLILWNLYFILLYKKKKSGLSLSVSLFISSSGLCIVWHCASFPQAVACSPFTSLALTCPRNTDNAPFLFTLSYSSLDSFYFSYHDIVSFISMSLLKNLFGGNA